MMKRSNIPSRAPALGPARPHLSPCATVLVAVFVGLAAMAADAPQPSPVDAAKAAAEKAAAEQAAAEKVLAERAAAAKAEAEKAAAAKAVADKAAGEKSAVE
ncbi:MAG: hypothetical protein AB1705_28170, partial [Verrucomicrobiota bacterium]